MVQNENKKYILIITDNPLPQGFAGTKRIRGYIKGFTDNQCTVETVIFHPNKLFYLNNKEFYGFINDSKFIYPGKNTKRSESFLLRQYNDFKSFTCTIFYYLLTILRRKISFVIFYGEYPVFEFILILLSKVFRIKILKEINENPYTLNSYKTTFNRLYLFNINKYDGLLVMTKTLKSLFSSISKKNNLLQIHNCIDCEILFNNESSSEHKTSNDYMLISGSLNDQKDGILHFLNFYLENAERFEGLGLTIVAYGDIKAKEKINKLIDDKIKLRYINFFFEIRNDEISELVKKAKILIINRQKNIQTESGFPTKLIEFCCYAKPIICTEVGEIGDFFTHKQNILFFNSEEIESVLTQIKWVVNNYDQAMRIANEAKTLLIKEFNCVIETNKILNYVN